MRHITPTRVIIALLLIGCGVMFTIIIRQRETIDRFAQYSESDKQNHLANTAFALDGAQRHVPDLASPTTSPDDLSRNLQRAVAYIEQAEISMQSYETVRRRSGEPPILLFDRVVFQEYKSALYPIIRSLGRQNAATAEQRAVLAGINHDMSVLHKVTFDHVILVQDAAGRQDGRLNDRELPKLADNIQAILPTLKVNSIRQSLGLFPGIFPQEDRASGANQLSLALGASTTCAEVGQPVTFTLELERYGEDDPPISLESVEIIISGNGRQERWSAVDAEDRLTLDNRETRTYEWIWSVDEEFGDTTLLVEARAKMPQDGPKPTPDANGILQENPVVVDLKLGVGALTQTWEEQLSVHNYPDNKAPRTLPCAQMVR